MRKKFLVFLIGALLLVFSTYFFIGKDYYVSSTTSNFLKKKTFNYNAPDIVPKKADTLPQAKPKEKYLVELALMDTLSSLAQYKQFEEYADLYVDMDPNGIYHIVLGDFYALEDVEVLLEYVKSQGIRDAQIIVQSLDTTHTYK